jgi:hypothetical protein
MTTEQQNSTLFRSKLNGTSTYTAKDSVTGTRTLVSRVRAVCPNHLDYNGLVKPLGTCCQRRAFNNTYHVFVLSSETKPAARRPWCANILNGVFAVGLRQSAGAAAVPRATPARAPQILVLSVIQRISIEIVPFGGHAENRQRLRAGRE